MYKVIELARTKLYVFRANLEEPCEDFLHTLPHEIMHSQNSFRGGTIT